ncbi:MAG: hypothetical protein D6748_00110 [Calditrichaeota bacterium]|nr:MAG: hypothetical protein D6748_00110 [Calditrichota bacterium]
MKTSGNIKTQFSQAIILPVQQRFSFPGIMRLTRSVSGFENLLISPHLKFWCKGIEVISIYLFLFV